MRAWLGLVLSIFLSGCTDYYWSMTDNGLPVDTNVQVLSYHHRDTLWTGSFDLRSGFLARLDLGVDLDSSMDSILIASPFGDLPVRSMIGMNPWIEAAASDRNFSLSIWMDYATTDSVHPPVESFIRISEWKLAVGRASTVLPTGDSILDTIQVRAGDSLMVSVLANTALSVLIMDSASNQQIWDRSMGSDVRMRIEENKTLYYKVRNTLPTLLAFSDTLWVQRILIGE